MNTQKRFINPFKRLGKGLFYLALSFGAVSAQAHENPESANEGLDSAAFHQEIVITATRKPQKAFEVPQSITQISEEEIKRKAPLAFSDLLSDVPGVSMSGSGFWESAPVIRGFSGNRVLVLVDGNRENNLWAGRDPLTPFLDVSQIQRIEVLRGPASVLYGTDAVGGVINIITKHKPLVQEGAWQFKPSLATGYSSVDEGLFGQVGLNAYGQGFDVHASYLQRKTENYTDGNGNEVKNSQFETDAYVLEAGYQFNPNHYLSAGYRRNDIDDKGVPQKENAAYSHFTTFDTDSYHLMYRGLGFGRIQELQLNTWLIDQKRIYDGNIASTSQPMYTLKSNLIETGAAGVSMQMELDIHSDHTVMTGFEYVYEDATSSETQLKNKSANDKTAKLITFPPVSNADRAHFGLYAQDQWRLSKAGMLLITGLRYDYFNASADDAVFKTVAYESDGVTVKKTVETLVSYDEADDQAVTFNLGFLYPFTQSLNFTTTLASGFRAPDIFERFSTRGGSYIILGNPELDPEYSTTLDAGFKFSAENVRMEVSGYYSWVSDYIDLVNLGDSLNGLPTRNYINVSDAHLYGVEGSVEYMPMARLTLFGNAAYVVGKNNTTQDRLNDIPPLTGLLGARWNDNLMSDWQYWFEFSTDLVASQNDPAPGEKATLGYALLDIRGGLSFSEQAALTLAVENVLDKTYRNHLNSADFLYEPGINFKATLRLNL